MRVGRNPLLVPVPFRGLAYARGFLSEPFPFAPLTRNQVELMQTDNVAGHHPGFRELGIAPRSIEEVLRETRASLADRELIDQNDIGTAANEQPLDLALPVVRARRAG